MNNSSSYRNYINESFTYEPEKMTRWEYVKYGGLAVFLLVLIVLYVLEFPHFSNTFDMKSLVLWSLLLGAIVGMGIGYGFRKEAADLTERVQLYLFLMVLTMIYAPLVGSLTNRLLSFDTASAEAVEFVETVPFYADRFGILKGEQIRPNAYHTFFYRQGRLSYVRSSTPLFPDAKMGATVEIKTRQGFWGYDCVVIN
ncbi:MAG: hypothetical protein AAGK47_03285 [Bacteroidota bacterium]